MSGAVPLIPYIPSWRRRGKLNVLPPILILSCNIQYGFESGRYPTADHMTRPLHALPTPDTSRN